MKVFSFTDNFTLGVSRRLPAGRVGGLDFTSSSSFCRKLAPGGTLTLGAGHKLVDGDVEMLPYMSLPGKIALFRLWRREWSEEEVTSLGCVEGEMVTWWWEDWETRDCAPLPEDNLTCGESRRERLRFHSGDMFWGVQVCCAGLKHSLCLTGRVVVLRGESAICHFLEWWESHGAARGQRDCARMGENYKLKRILNVTVESIQYKTNPASPLQ